MERLKKTKNIFIPKKMNGRFHLEKEYKKREKLVTGGFSIIPNQKITITSVKFELFQTLQIDDETVIVTLGSQTVKNRGEILPLQTKRQEFAIPLSFTKSKRRQKKIYNTEMALMDRLHDESQKQRYTYEIIATVTIKGDSKKIDFSNKIVIK